jgi:hypothetical protein
MGQRFIPLTDGTGLVRGTINFVFNNETGARRFGKLKGKRYMAKTVTKILGVVFLLVGFVGFFAPGILGMHLSMAHNIVHLVSGALALYFGLTGPCAPPVAFASFSGWFMGYLGCSG